MWSRAATCLMSASGSGWSTRCARAAAGRGAGHAGPAGLQGRAASGSFVKALPCWRAGHGVSHAGPCSVRWLGERPRAFSELWLAAQLRRRVRHAAALRRRSSGGVPGRTPSSRRAPGLPRLPAAPRLAVSACQRAKFGLVGLLLRHCNSPCSRTGSAAGALLAFLALTHLNHGFLRQGQPCGNSLDAHMCESACSTLRVCFLHCGGCWRTCSACAAVHGTGGFPGGAQAHPGVHARMLRDGWDKRPGVRVIFGRWCARDRRRMVLACGSCITAACMAALIGHLVAAEALCATGRFKQLAGGVPCSCWSCQRWIIDAGTGVHAAQRTRQPASSRAGRTPSASSGGSLTASSSTPTQSSMRTCGAGCPDPAGGCPVPLRWGGQGAVASQDCSRQSQAQACVPKHLLKFEVSFVVVVSFCSVTL
jgi:hypothetical protein